MIDSLVAILPKFRTGTDKERQRLIDGLPLNLSAGGAAARQRARVLRDLPLDSGSFAARFGPDARCELVDGLREFCLGFHGESSDFRQSNEIFYGFLSVLLVTLNGLHESEARRSEGGAADQGRPARAVRSPAHDCEATCKVLVEDPLVRQAIAATYRPSRKNKAWDDLDLQTLSFHEHGSTSMILRCQAFPSRGRPDEAAIKLILQPFLSIATIAKSTREYVSFNRVSSSHLVHVWDSGEGWIIMDFADGIELRELLRHDRLIRRKMAEPGETFSRLAAGIVRDEIAAGRAPAAITEGRVRTASLSGLVAMLGTIPDTGKRNGPRAAVDLERMRFLGDPLFDALHDLSEVGLEHQDLGPQNIIVADSAGLKFKLVDIGRNYLFTHSLTGFLSVEGSYIAPEVKEGAADASNADLYSLGQLLIEFSGIRHRIDGRVPDELYIYAPPLARFLEDLVEHNRERRLVIFTEPPGASSRYERLRKSFREELAATLAARDSGLGSVGRPSAISIMNDLRHPLADMPGRMRRLLRVRKEQKLSKEPARGRQVRWLLFWSWMSAVALTLGMSVAVMWLLRDLGWGWQDWPVEVLQKIYRTEQSGTLPFVDNLRVPGYLVPDWRENIPGRAFSISMSLSGARYYEAIFGGVSPYFSCRVKGSLRCYAILAEIFMRVSGIVSLPIALYVTLVNVHWWPIGLAIGQTEVLACNAFTAMFANKAIRAARLDGVSAVSDTAEVTGLRDFTGWTPSSVHYCTVLWVLAPLLYLKVVHDVYVYSLAVSSLNIVGFYAIICGIRSPYVRVALTRACVYAERLQKTTHPLPGP